MPSPYLNQLIKIAQEELPVLQYDLLNASTVFTLQAAGQKMHNILTYLVHHAILSEHPAAIAAASQPPAPPPPQQPQHAAPVGVAPALNYFPQTQPASHPAHVAAPVFPPGYGPPPQSSQVAEVFMTPQGARVIPPGSNVPVAVMPPGSHIDLAAIQRPMAPPVAGDVMLPQGGAMTPEVAAALGARNITADPAPAQ